MRFALSIFAVLWLAACSREPAEEPSQKVNSRLAKSGQQLADEPEIPVANDSSESIAGEGKKTTPRPAGNAPAAGSSSKATALTPAQLEALKRRALAGEVAAQLELGNAHFEGNGVPVNKKAAEYWWRLAAAQQNEVAADNLRLLNFLLSDSLGGGGSASLLTDAQGKTHGLALLRLEMDIPHEVINPMSS